MKKKKKSKFRVVSTNPAVLSTNPPPEKALEVTLRFEVDDLGAYDGPGLLVEWINGTFDNADYSSEDAGYPAGLGMPMVVDIRETE